MLSGVQEILLIVAILMAIFFIPRMTRNRSQGTNKSRPLSVRIHLSGRRRLALLASLLWPTGIALYLEPWHTSSIVPFLYFGLGPVLLCWSIMWVMAGFSEKRKK